MFGLGGFFLGKREEKSHSTRDWIVGIMVVCFESILLGTGKSKPGCRYILIIAASLLPLILGVWDECKVSWTRDMESGERYMMRYWPSYKPEEFQRYCICLCLPSWAEASKRGKKGNDKIVLKHDSWKKRNQVRKQQCSGDEMKSCASKLTVR